MNKPDDLSIRLTNLSDKEILNIFSDTSNMYSDDAIQIAQQIAQFRGLFSNFTDSEFKMITAGGRENGPFDVIIIKDLFLKKLITAESLSYVESENKWLPLKEVFNISLWKTKDKDANVTDSIENELIQSSSNIQISQPPIELKTEQPNKLKAEEKQTLDTPIIIDDEKDNNRYKGVKGWLALFIIYLIIGRLLNFFSLRGETMDFSTNIHSFATIIGGIDLAVGLMVAIALLYSKNIMSIIIAKFYFISLLIFNILFLFWAILHNDSEFLITNKVFLLTDRFISIVIAQTLIVGKYVVIQPNIAQTIFLAFLVTFWYVYFSISKRVKATYYDNDISSKVDDNKGFLSLND